MRRTRKVSRKAPASIQHEMSKIADDLSSLASTLGETASAEARATIGSLRDRFEGLKDYAGSMTDDVLEGAESSITENPFVAVAAAFGVGLILSLLLQRR
jgi:ElaB/YqjD/DUF883 family membrane-anchored ribosome-binding protein